MSLSGLTECKSNRKRKKPCPSREAFIRRKVRLTDNDVLWSDWQLCDVLFCTYVSGSQPKQCSELNGKITSCYRDLMMRHSAEQAPDKHVSSFYTLRTKQ